MKRFLAALLVAAAAGGALAGDAPAGPFTGRIDDRSRICMMQDSLQPKTGLAHEYRGRTYFLCCEMCVQSFTADPERFAHAKDPVNGTVVDKATAPAYAVAGKAFFFSSESTLRTFAADPRRFLPAGPGGPAATGRVPG
ncbi:MAG TPA: YHS domain-containing protein [Candidatus Binatia bacterium]|nr:YHS domain-containing protein [Candidatus Binatia bacterium]